MNKVGQYSPIGGTHPSQGWDTYGTPVQFSYIFLSIFSLVDREGADE
jgi:hypothetical protein